MLDSPPDNFAETRAIPQSEGYQKGLEIARQLLEGNSLLNMMQRNAAERQCELGLHLYRQKDLGICAGLQQR